MKSRKRALAPLAFAFLLTIAGCTVPPVVTPGDGGGELLQPTRLATDAACVTDGDLEGFFTQSSQMLDYLECVIPGVEAWIDATYASMPHPRAYYFVPEGVSGNNECPFDSESLQYCPGAQNVYLGETTVWALYSRAGDAAPALVVAHEVSHSFQHEVGMVLPGTGPEEIRYEDQADCGAGAFMNYAREQGMLNVDDDIVDLATALQLGGEAESADRSHGTIDERLQSFDYGYLDTSGVPLTACIVFVPELPIIATG